MINCEQKIDEEESMLYTVTVTAVYQHRRTEAMISETETGFFNGRDLAEGIDSLYKSILNKDRTDCALFSICHTVTK